MMTNIADGSRMPGWRSLLTLFLLAAGVRTVWVYNRYGPEQRLDYPDETAYWQVAGSLAEGRGLADEFGYRATYMPGYPAFLSLFADRSRPGAYTHLQWARLAQALLAAWVAPATCLFAARWLAMVRQQSDHGDTACAAPLLAGLAVAFDPFLVFFSGLMLTEALFAVCLVMTWACLVPMCLRNRRITRLSVIGTAVMLWSCLMLRPSAAVLIPLVPTVIVFSRRFDRSSLLAAAVVVILPVIGLVPWAARNHGVIGQWRWLTTRGGISLYDGFRPGASGDSNLADTKTMPQVQGMSETQWDRHFRDEAWSAIRQDPARVAHLAWLKLRRTWNPWPNLENYRGTATAHVGAAWTVCALLLASLGWWLTRRAIAAWLVLLLPAAAFTLLHMVYVGSVRYRVPFMPLILVLATVGAARLVALLRPAGARR